MIHIISDFLLPVLLNMDGIAVKHLAEPALPGIGISEKLKVVQEYFSLPCSGHDTARWPRMFAHVYSGL